VADEGLDIPIGDHFSGDRRMKVVLFCGGLGTRLREHSDAIPKPLVDIGYRPIIWHLMRYYAHFGHKDFILCLGYRGDMIRQFFLDFRAAMATDFVLSDGGRKIELLEEGEEDWRITCVDTGMHSNLGQRLARVKHLLKDEEMFLANYSDGLSDLPLDQHIAFFQKSNSIASFLSVRPSQSFHAVKASDDGLVGAIEPVSASDYWINGGFFCLKREIFNFLQPGEELVVEPFQRLIAEKKLSTLKYEGFWAAMDTFKDKITLNRMEARGDCPWMVWKNPA
jgi:glucose-1-phosphate cytidylyltransferase